MERLPNGRGGCPKAVLCEVKQLDAPPCGEDSDHLSPLPPAELMCVRALAGKFQVEDRKVREAQYPAYIAELSIGAAWFKAELGSAEPNPERAAEYRGEALATVDAAIRNPYSCFNDTYSAMMLGLYQPLLRAREHDMLIGHELEGVRQGLIGVYGSLRKAPTHVPQKQHITEAFINGEAHLPCFATEGERLGVTAKLVGMMLAAREDIVLYPGSNRERLARGTWAALNHDAYRLDADNNKLLIKFMNKQKSSKVAGGEREMYYDDSTVYFNLPAEINLALKSMSPSAKESFKSLQKGYGPGRPNLSDIGSLLQTELQYPESILPSRRTLLDILSARVKQRLLFESEDDRPPLKQEMPTPLPEMTEGESIQLAKPLWEILPDRIISSHANTSTHNNPKKLEAALSATETYLRYAHNSVPPEQLRHYISIMREVTEPTVAARCVGAYIDLARSPHTPPVEAVKIIEAGEALARTLTVKDWRNLSPQQVHAQHYVGLQSAYAEKYKKTLAGEVFDINDETKLYMQLLELGQTTLEPTNYSSQSRGIQFEIGVHILNARLNLRRGQMKQSMWPSLPREDEPHDFNFQYSTGWDIAVTKDKFLDQGTACQRLQCKSTNDKGMVYDPSIVTIVARDDLRTATTADIIYDALREQEASTNAIRSPFRTRLNEYERILIAKLGWS